MPEQATIRVKYTSDDPSHPQYEDAFGVDLINSGLWPLPTGGPDVPRSMKPPLSSFYKLGQAMVRSIGELSRYR